MSSTKRMEKRDSYLLVFFLFLIFFFTAETKPTTKKGILGKKRVSTILVFGDSTADPGNNNYIVTPFKANFPPYGQDFMQQIPTGRFTNGKLPNDYIAEYLGIKEYVPPYLDPTLSIEDLISGVSFASGGTGFDPLTSKIGNVISVSQQLEYFKEYKSRIAEEIGEEKAENVIKDAVFIISCGTNDFVVNYFNVPIQREFYTIYSYVDFCLQNVKHFLQELMNLGARRIGVAGLPPMGCLPIVITLYSNNPISNRGCITNASSIAYFYNQKLQFLLESTLTKENPNSRVRYFDIFGPLTEMIAQAQKYGFEDVTNGCCGTGLLEAIILCNPSSYICSDTSKYIFFDSIHPTERSYNIVFQVIRPAIDSIVHAEYLGIKDYVPPYLDPTLSIEELISGVSFASAGSGFDPLTPKISDVIPMSQQLEYLKEYKSRIAEEMGEEKAENVIKDAVIIISAGTNDFVVTYFNIPIRRDFYTVSTYVDFCLQNVKHFLQELLNLGARRIGMAGLPPMGCLPFEITLYSNDPISNRGCITNLSTIAQFYNQKLRFLLESTLAQQNPNSRIRYFDIFGPLTNMIVKAQNYGFDEVASGCCGTGFLETTILCNPNSYICPDTSKYVFFDSIHPSERTYNILFQAIRPAIDSILYG